jgi:uncharacterized protein (DUF1501 family)
MKRRDFLKTSSIAGAGLIAAPYIMKSSPLYDVQPVNKLLNTDDNILIIIELFGGNDGLNTIIPINEEDKYRELRENLYIPAEEAVRFEQSDLFFNKALVDGIHNNGFLQLMSEGKLGVVQGIGYGNPTLSHFRSRDIWQSGIISIDPAEKLLTGWLGRYFANALPDFPEVIPDHPLAIHLGGSMPLAFKSEKGHMGIALSFIDEFYQLGAGMTPKDDSFSDAEGDYFKEEFNFAHVIASQSERYSVAVKEAYDAGIGKIKVNYSDGGLSQQFRTISALIAGGLDTKVYYLRLSNFDSHAQQMTVDYAGAHATLLAEVAAGVSEFLDDAQQQGYHERVAGMTVSEFGRRAADNGSRGTDHGMASIQFMFAGSDQNINGGFFNNDGQPVLSKLLADNNIDYTYDFRRTYADALELWLNADSAITQEVFNENISRLEVLRQRGTSVRNYLATIQGKQLVVYPNPNHGRGKIEFTAMNNCTADISIFSISGRKAVSLHNGFLTHGKHSFDFNLHTSGNYFVNININGNIYSEKIMVLK